jgi:methionyl-tRNA formyltransferase
LPRGRGAAPIQRAIMAGDRETGVQVMRMTEGLDEGPVLMTARVGIEAEDTAGTLHDKLMLAGSELLPRALAAIEGGTAVATPQAEDGATYARKIKPAEARIDWSRPATEIDRRIRGLSPFPGAWFVAETTKGPVRVKALLSRLGLGSGAPGELLDDRLLVACGDGAVRLLRVQAEGRKAQDGEEFLRGRTLLADASLA